MFHPHPTIEVVPITPAHNCLVIDNALTDPERWVELAAQHRTQFAASPHNAYPGLELRMPDALSARLNEFFALHIRRRLGARRTLRMYSRLALATLAPEQMSPRQWICHRDRIEIAPDRCIAASVLYLFHDAAMGGTGFFVPRKSESEIAMLIHESGSLDAADFSAKYGLREGYQTGSNAWFEKTAAIPAKWNRLIFYDGGSVFHCSDITAPNKLSADPRTGRLTLNGFFICRRAAE